MLSKIEFEILTYIDSHSDFSSESLPEYNTSEVEECFNSLSVNGYIENGTLTEKAYKALEPYRVKRAIFFAAGFGSRMVPITYELPKPMVPVNGKRIIETLIDAVVAVGIKDIIIVRGYLKEKFDALLEKYPFITLVDNDDYSSANNILSAYIVRDKIVNTYTFEADLFLLNQSLITKYQYQSNYTGVKVDNTPDWCFITDENKKIVEIKKGGDDCYHMFGIGYVSQSDGERLSGDIERVYETIPESHSHFWDDVALLYCNESYDFTVRDCSFSDLAELDTYDDLKKMDSSYR